MSISKFAKVFEFSTLTLLLTTSLSAIVHASLTRVFLDPPSLTVEIVGDSFTVNVSISDVASLYGYDFNLYYSSIAMNGTQVFQGSFLESGGPTFFRVTNFTDHYDSTQGLVSVACTLIGNVSGVDGGGVLATIKFKSLTLADSTILHLADVELRDLHLSPIQHEIVDGTVTVVPEFTSLVAFPTLIAASFFLALVRRRPTCGRVKRAR